MKKILALAIITTAISCTPYRKLFLPANLHPVLNDTCDLQMVKRVSQAYSGSVYPSDADPGSNLEDLMHDPDCFYYARKLLTRAHQDSSIWLMMTKPVQIGEDEIILGSLFTIRPKNDSTLRFERRIKEYEQGTEFESGRYVVFTYFIKNDSTTIIKAGKRKMD